MSRRPDDKPAGAPAQTPQPSEETDLWRRYTRGIRPMAREAQPARDKPEAPGSATMAGESQKATPIPRPERGRTPPLDRPAAPVLTPGQAPGLDKRTLQRLKRGLIAPEGRLDLHNMSQDEAHTALTRFIAHAQTAGRRCVLVITGKGRSSEGMVGVLKQQVPLWLNEPVLRARILAFAHATPAYGGDGALFVMLKRSNKMTQRN